MADYYISTTGSNVNSGLTGHPWLTLAYACDHATTSGDIIHVIAGTYTETLECNLRVGVSIEGAGDTSWIKSHFTATRLGDVSGASINLTSASEGTNGNQHISGIKLDGDAQTGSVGILVFKRKNVTIHNCTIRDFYIGGIALHGTSYHDEPTTYATGCQIYNCNLIDNGDTDTTWDGMGQIEIGGTDGLLIHDNIITGTGRTPGHNGNILSGSWYNKGTKYYSNKSYKPDYDAGSWNFHIEMWNVEGGFEVYNNEFYGGDNPIDIAGNWNYSGAYDYSWYIHDNLFYGNPVVHGKNAIQMEDTYIEDVLIENNHFINWPCVINTTNGGDSPTQILKNIHIQTNLIEYEIPWTYEDEYYDIMRLRCAVDAGDFDGFYIENNVIKGPTDAYTTAIKLEVESGATILNMYIRNNIILNHANATWLNVPNDGSIDHLHVDNNVLYNNAGSDDPSFTGNAVTNYTFTDNVKDNPDFVSSSDYHLQAGSPAIAAGVNVGITYDYEGKPFVDPPSSGIYEYGTVANIPVTSVVVSATGGVPAITVNGGTLQMIATILPVDATDQTVTWSVTNGSGTAIISPSGLLTAVTNGTVTVTATANG